jgi:16S rRNA A1518/A1519 N6-dimethyltransferase RsmA/KsgA/DIM1 with predicted DNA glycosylase/AP lyase activity
MTRKKGNENPVFFPDSWSDGSFNPNEIQTGSKYDQAYVPKKRRSSLRPKLQESDQPSQRSEEVDPNLLPFSRLDPNSRRARREKIARTRSEQYNKSEAPFNPSVRRKEFHTLTAQELDALMPFCPIENLGQNFLVNDDIARRFVNFTIPGASVVEVGIGTGNMTWGIAQKADNVIGLEIYPGFAPCHETTLADSQNVKVIFADALSFNFKKWAERNHDRTLQVMGNIPFHISEGLITRLAALGDSISSITLLVGGNLRDIIEASDNPHSQDYSKLAFYLSVYDKSSMTYVQKTDFWPSAPVSGGLVNLTPRDYDPRGKDFTLKIKKQLVLNPELSPAKIINGLFTSGGKNRTKEDSHRYERRQVRQNLNRMVAGREDSGRAALVTGRINLPADILNTPFSRLSNQQIRSLAIALDNL